jgi:hypothetical protein
MYRSSIYQRGADAQLQRGVTRLLQRATLMLGQMPPERIRNDLLDASADCAGLAAYACRDLGQHEWAQRHYLLAMQAAQAAGDQCPPAVPDGQLRDLYAHMPFVRAALL